MKRLRLSNKVRTAFQGRSRGLTLVELVIAIALIGIIAVALLGGLSNAIMSLVVADVRTTAESLARSEMEHVKNSPYDSIIDPAHPQYSLDPDIAIPPGYDIAITAARLDPENDGTNDDDGIQEITVTVSHHDKEVVTLVGYKVTDET